MNRPVPQAALTLLSEPEIRAIVHDAIAEGLADFVPAEKPTLLDRHAMARELSCSVATLDKLRREPGFPELRLLDSPRFEAAAVVQWIRERKVSQ